MSPKIDPCAYIMCEFGAVLLWAEHQADLIQVLSSIPQSKGSGICQVLYGLCPALGRFLDLDLDLVEGLGL